MMDSPTILQSQAQLTAVIHIKVPRDEIQAVMGPAIGEVMSAITAQGQAPAGPVFSHHFRLNPDHFDFEIGVPVAQTIAAVGRVVPGHLAARQVARTVYHGSYDGLGSAWREFDQWIQAQGLRPAEDLWECYTLGPESSPDPARWRTEFNRPLQP